MEKVEMTDVTKATFGLLFNTNESGQNPNNDKAFNGEIQLVDGEWTVSYDDGIVHKL